MLLNTRKVTVRYGARAVLDELEFRVDARERVGLIGRNGVGKSTLLKLLGGSLEPDGGDIQRTRDLVVASVDQVSETAVQASALEVATAGKGDAAARRAEALLTQLSVPTEATYAELSGGQMRRVMLAKALAEDAGLLLLDEPTNHLDLKAILWLEGVLAKSRQAMVMITHDRVFLQALATRIVEVDRGRAYSYPGTYADFLRRRDAERESQARAEARFDKRLAEEEVWIRQGIKARRTRNEGRVRALEAMRRERTERVQRQGIATLRAQETERSGRLVAEVEGISHAYDTLTIVRDFSLTILRGDKFGLIGPNGSGKTTLLKLLTGELEPQGGSVRLGTRLDVGYFDQHRADFAEDATVFECVADGAETVTVSGASRHVLSYLKDFLFTPEQARGKVRTLSGGERSRLALARLFARPSNFLILDEPTNDLDIETLELLEELLHAYEGTLLIASHDRALLNNVVTSTLVMEGNGHIGEYVGGYDDWLRQRKQPESAKRAASAKPAGDGVRAEARTKLSYKDQRELNGLPARIEALEASEKALQEKLCDPKVYQNGDEAAATKKALSATQTDLHAAYERWEALEALR